MAGAAEDGTEIMWLDCDPGITSSYELVLMIYYISSNIAIFSIFVVRLSMYHFIY